ncbi:MAG: hypothetical protein ABGY11_07505 [Candidatus Thioglobus sp.]|jgi:hypothetical protein
MNIKRKTELVAHLLGEYPHLRDDDYKLIATIWKMEVEQHSDIRTMKAIELLTLMADGKLSNPESIRRSRAKIQQEVESLRGKNYIKRHRHQADVIDQLHEMQDELN